ncbi:hypothetical protein ACFQ88_23170 [Paenibacillus sp. NPDC056579]|uniref:hypothetical protein n=1 Tax=Paenibacillus sp. NPDC056579 TaxID=3345871 RepID=UPI0036991BA9
MIFETISKYHHGSASDKHHRYLSWAHCYGFFRQNKDQLTDVHVFDHACLHLAFYLASWGMLRGSSFLLQKDYKVHEYVLRELYLNTDTYQTYYEPKFSHSVHNGYFDGIDQMIETVRRAYSDNIFSTTGEDVSVTDTLVSKILLGLFGNMPAYDRYFLQGLKVHGLKNTILQEKSLNTLIEFYKNHEEEFIKCQKLLESHHTQYTPMKLVDMYFWQVGYMMSEPSKFSERELDTISSFADSCVLRINNTAPIHTSRVAAVRGLTEEIRKYILDILMASRDKEKPFVDLVSGEIHKSLNLKDRMPSVCSAMLSVHGNIEVLYDTPSGMSSTKKVRYWLNS